MAPEMNCEHGWLVDRVGWDKALAVTEGSGTGFDWFYIGSRRRQDDN